MEFAYNATRALELQLLFREASWHVIQHVTFDSGFARRVRAITIEIEIEIIYKNICINRLLPLGPNH
jgi:hypothetical protein